MTSKAKGRLSYLYRENAPSLPIFSFSQQECFNTWVPAAQGQSSTFSAIKPKEVFPISLTQSPRIKVFCVFFPVGNLCFSIFLHPASVQRPSFTDEPTHIQDIPLELEKSNQPRQARTKNMWMWRARERFLPSKPGDKHSKRLKSIPKTTRKAGKEQFMLLSCQQLDSDAEKHRPSPWSRAGVSCSPCVSLGWRRKRKPSLPQRDNRPEMTWPALVRCCSAPLGPANYPQTTSAPGVTNRQISQTHQQAAVHPAY